MRSSRLIGSVGTAIVTAVLVRLRIFLYNIPPRRSPLAGQKEALIPLGAAARLPKVSRRGRFGRFRSRHQAGDSRHLYAARAGAPGATTRSTHGATDWPWLARRGRAKDFFQPVRRWQSVTSASNTGVGSYVMPPAPCPGLHEGQRCCAARRLAMSPRLATPIPPARTCTSPSTAWSAAKNGGKARPSTLTLSLPASR